MMDNSKSWQGYDFDDLRFKRVLSQTRIELEKHKLHNDIQTIYGNKGRASSIFSNLSGAMNYLDYALIAFRLGSRVIKMFRKGKR